jgi:hypothetical protein
MTNPPQGPQGPYGQPDPWNYGQQPNAPQQRAGQPVPRPGPEPADEQRPPTYTPAWSPTPEHGSAITRAPRPTPPTGATTVRMAGHRKPDTGGRKRRGLMITLVAVLVLGVTGTLGWWYLLRDTGPPRATRGDCLIEPYGNDPKPAACSDPAAKFMVITVVKNSTDPTTCTMLPGGETALSRAMSNGDMLCVARR